MKATVMNKAIVSIVGANTIPKILPKDKFVVPVTCRINKIIINTTDNLNNVIKSSSVTISITRLL